MHAYRLISCVLVETIEAVRDAAVQEKRIRKRAIPGGFCLSQCVLGEISLKELVFCRLKALITPCRVEAVIVVPFLAFARAIGIAFFAVYLLEALHDDVPVSRHPRDLHVHVGDVCRDEATLKVESQ